MYRFRIFLMWAMCSFVLLARAQVYNNPGGTLQTCSGAFNDRGATGDYANNELITTTICSNAAGQEISVNFTSFNTESGYDLLRIYDGPNATSPLLGTFSGTVSPGTITSSSGCLTFVFDSDGSIVRAGWTSVISCIVVPCITPTCPVPDECSIACNLGTLTAPAACPSAASAVNIFCLSNVGATPTMPYNTLSGCQGSATMPNPSADVWYSFIASSNIIDVRIQGLNAPNLSFYEGSNCNSVIGQGCAVGSAGLVNATFQGVTAGRKYYLRISGADTNDVGAFRLRLVSRNDCDPCMITHNLVVTPPPVNSVYQPGQRVHFCFTVTQWSAAHSNWIHAVIPTFGAGWDRTSLSVTPPPSCDGDGTWNWYTSVTSSATNTARGPGFFYESTSSNLTSLPNNPGDNYGDYCTGTVSFVYCWDITVSNCPPSTHGTNLNLSINTFGDGESGSWSDFACAADPLVNFFATLSCCPQPTLRSRDVSCAGGNDGRIIANARGRAPYTYNWLDTAGNVLKTVVRNTPDTLFNLSAGDYTIEITDDLSCFTTNTFTLTEPPAINANLNSINISCNGIIDGSITSSAAGGVAPYEYSLDGVNFQPSNLFPGLAAGTYIITVRDDSTCVTLDTATITEPALLALAIDSTLDATCFAASNGAIAVTAAGGTTPYEFALDGITFQTADSFSGLGQGNYTITVRDARACTATQSAVVNEPLPLFITLDSITSAACFGANTGAVYTTVSGGTLPYNFLWSNTDNTEDIFNLPGDSSYIIAAVDANLCAAADTFTVPQGGGFMLSTTTGDVTCNGNADGSAQVTVTNGTQPIEYLWSNGDTLQTAANIRAGIYSVIVIDGNRCTDTIDAIVNEPALLSLLGATTPSSCILISDGEIQLTAAGGIAPYTYSLDGVSFQSTPLFNGLLSSNYQAVVRDSNNCTASIALNVAAGAPFATTVTTTDVHCFGGSDGTASVSVPGYSSSGFICRWSTTETDSAISALIAGNYFVTVTDSNGCAAYDTATVSAPTALTLAPSSTVDVLCSGGNNGLIGITVSGGTPAYSYAWNNGQTAATADSLTAGIYSVVVTDSNNCTIADTFTIVEPLPVSFLTNSTPVTCNGESNGVASVTPSGGTAPFIYVWDVAANSQGTSNAVNLAAGNYNVTVTDAHNCRDSVQISITEPTALIAHLDTVINPLCYGYASGSITVSATGGTGAYSYSWDDSSKSTSSVPPGLTAGEYHVTVTDANGCTDILTAIVTEPPLLTVAILPEDTSIVFGDSVQLVAMHTPASVEPSYNWQPVDGIAWCVSPCANPFVSPTLETIFSLTIVDPNTGCTAEATARVGVEHENVIFPPNAFTPDGDGVNDEFEIFFGPSLVSLNYSIFNRWGEKLFQTNTLGDFWDGTYRGKTMNAGVYVFTLRATFLDKEEKFYKGTFTLLR